MAQSIRPYLKRTGAFQPPLSVSKKHPKPSPSQDYDPNKLPRFFDNPDLALPLVLCTPETQRVSDDEEQYHWHSLFTLRHPAWLVLLAEVAIDCGPNPTLQEVIDKAHDRGVLALVKHAAECIDMYDKDDEYVSFFEGVECPCDMVSPFRGHGPRPTWFANDPSIVRKDVDALPWFCTVFTREMRQALDGADVGELMRLYVIACREIDDLTYGEILRRVAQIGTYADIDALRVLTSANVDHYSDDFFGEYFVNAKRSICARRWRRVREHVATKYIAQYWGRMAARPDAHGRAPPGTLSAYVADGW